MKCVIWVEGIADQKFLADVLNDWYGYFFEMKNSKTEEVHFEFSDGTDSIKIQSLQGHDKITSQAKFKSQLQAAFELNKKEGTKNIVLIDTDDNFSERLDEVKTVQTVSTTSFSYFLIPNNRDAGDLETLLFQIINPAHRSIFECWTAYETCLKTQGKYTLPARKTMVYAYLEALLKDSKSQKELIKEGKRNYQNKDHWDLNPENEPLKPLKAFFDQHLLKE